MSTKTQVEWRRNMTLSLSSKGYSQIEIAKQLQVNEVTVSRDMAYLRKQAQDNLQHHIHEIIPFEYQMAMSGLKDNLRETIQIADTTSDPRIKLQARSIAGDNYKYIMDLCTNAGVISEAIKFVNLKTEQIDSMTLKLKTIGENENKNENSKGIIDEYENENENEYEQTNEVY